MPEKPQPETTSDDSSKPRKRLPWYKRHHLKIALIALGVVPPAIWQGQRIWDEATLKEAQQNFSRAIEDRDGKTVLAIMKHYPLDRLAEKPDSLIYTAFKYQTITPEERLEMVTMAMKQGGHPDNLLYAALMDYKHPFRPSHLSLQEHMHYVEMALKAGAKPETKWRESSHLALALTTGKPELYEPLLKHLDEKKLPQCVDALELAIINHVNDIVRPLVGLVEVDDNFTNLANQAITSNNHEALTMLTDRFLSQLPPGEEAVQGEWAARSWNFVHAMCRSGDTDLLEPFLRRGIRPRMGMAEAAETNNRAMAEMLLKYDIPANEWGYALSNAAQGKTPEMIDFLIDHGADPNTRVCFISINERNAIHFLTGSDQFPTRPENIEHYKANAERLVTRGANIYSKAFLPISNTETIIGKAYKNWEHASPELIRKCEEAFHRFDVAKKAPENLDELYLMLAAFRPDDPRGRSNPPKTARELGTTSSDNLSQVVDTEAQLKFIFSHAQWKNTEHAQEIAGALLARKRIGHALKEELLTLAEAFIRRQPGQSQPSR